MSQKTRWSSRWWPRPLIPVLRKQRQGELRECEASLGYRDSQGYTEKPLVWGGEREKKTKVDG